MDKLNFETWYEELKKQAPAYGFSNDLMAKISETRWRDYYLMGYSPTGGLCDYSFEATGMV